MGFKLGSEKREYKSSKNTPIFRKKLEGGILGEANKDGSIFIDKGVPKGSKLEREVINHESKHAKDMADGKLSYGDDYVRYNGKTYKREKGKIKYNGKWLREGDESFPWEKAAYNTNK